MRILNTLILALGLAVSAPVNAGETALQATLFKSPQCGCCEGHAEHLRAHGFDVKVMSTHDLPLIKRDHGVPEALEGCHTIVIGDYVVEGHVSADTIKRLLRERPAIRGISLPGMPDGSPGMSGRKTTPFTVYEIRDGAPEVYARE
jgi:hypothetical protein